MPEERPLFSMDSYGAITPTDPHLKTEEKPRLSAQCQAILDLLSMRQATNRELADISLKYTSRISDLRAAGYDIQVTERDHATGLTRYALVK